jgi:hypothetical protein
MVNFSWRLLSFSRELLSLGKIRYKELYMRQCGSCGASLVRVRRTFFQKFAYHAIMMCPKCGQREARDQWFLFLFGKTSRCPRCGSFRVEKLRGVDHIDPMYKNPLSYLQKWLGGTLRWCPYCRLQFYDVRRKVPTPKRSPPVRGVEEPQASPTAKSGD